MAENCQTAFLTSVGEASDNVDIFNTVALCLSSGVASDRLYSILTPPVVISSAVTSETLTTQVVQLFIDVGEISDSFSSIRRETNVLSRSIGEAEDSVFTFAEELVVSTVVASDTLISVPDGGFLTSSALSSDTVSTSVSTAKLNVSVGAASDSTARVVSEFLEAAGDASETVSNSNVTGMFLSSAAVGEDTIFISASITQNLLSSTGIAELSQVSASSNTLQLAYSAGVINDELISTFSPFANAFLCNAQSLGMWRFTNYDFESAAQSSNTIFLVSEKGLYQMGGEQDIAADINAGVSYRYYDFRIPETKRIENLYVGYRSLGTVALSVSVLESGITPDPYLMEPRPADEPRNSRIPVGKGLRGRYWKMDFRNVDGVDFEIYDIAVDFGVSNRRI